MNTSLDRHTFIIWPCPSLQHRKQTAGSLCWLPTIQQSSNRSTRQPHLKKQTTEPQSERSELISEKTKNIFAFLSFIYKARALSFSVSWTARKQSRIFFSFQTKNNKKSPKAAAGVVEEKRFQRQILQKNTNFLLGSSGSISDSDSSSDAVKNKTKARPGLLYACPVSRCVPSELIRSARPADTN